MGLDFKNGVMYVSVYDPRLPLEGKLSPKVTDEVLPQ